MQLAEKLVAAVERAQEGRPQTDRPYLGGSILGDFCRRKMWLGFRGMPKKRHGARLLRIFQQGHDIEDQLLKLLSATPGVVVMARDPESGRQWEVSKFGGHVKSHYDGLIKAKGILCDTDEWHLLEIKSMNQSKFEDTVARGVSLVHPLYYSQMQFYMHGSQAGARPVKRALFLAMCKDNACLHAELVDYDPFHGHMLDTNGISIIEANEPPPRIAKDRTWAACRMCDFQEPCWGTDPIKPTDCRQCQSAYASQAHGAWYCMNRDSDRYTQEAKTPCPHFASILSAN